MFIGLLTGVVNASNHTKGVSLSNQKCMIQSTLINFVLLVTYLMKYVFQIKQKI